MSRSTVNRDLVLLHWLVALLFLIAVTGIVGRGWLPSEHPFRPLLRSAHIAVGQCIFLLALVRVAVRWRHPPPAAHAVAPWQARASQGAHALLYVVMFLQPLSGVLFMQAGDKPVGLFGWSWPTVMPSDAELHFALKDLHGFVGNAFYALITLHVGAALWHHYVLRDDTLRRMRPWRTTPRVAAVASRPPATIHALPAQRAAAARGRGAWNRTLPTPHRPAAPAPAARPAHRPAHARHDAAAEVE